MKNEKEGGKECGASLHAAPPGLAPARGCAPHWTVGVGCSGVSRASSVSGERLSIWIRDQGAVSLR